MRSSNWLSAGSPESRAPTSRSRSAPAEKLPPAPVMIATRTPSSASIMSQASHSRQSTSASTAFFLAGRLSVRVTTWTSRSTRTAASASDIPSGLAGDTAPFPTRRGAVATTVTHRRRNGVDSSGGMVDTVYYRCRQCLLPTDGADHVLVRPVPDHGRDPPAQPHHRRERRRADVPHRARPAAGDAAANHVLPRRSRPRRRVPGDRPALPALRRRHRPVGDRRMDRTLGRRRRGPAAARRVLPVRGQPRRDRAQPAGDADPGRGHVARRRAGHARRGTAGRSVTQTRPARDASPARRSPAVSPATSARERLLQAARDVLTDDGLEGLTLRAIARRAGVSHGAPLRHFPSLAALLSAVAAEGFARLVATIDDRLVAADRAFAHADPGVFSVTFRPERVDVSDPEYQTQGYRSFQQLVGLAEAAQAEGWRPDEPAEALAAVLWSHVHGLAVLSLHGSLGSVAGSDMVGRLH